MNKINIGFTVPKSEIVSILEQWQNEMMHSLNLVHVIGFNLEPQAKGFMLELTFYIADEHDPELPDHKEYFYGELNECFGNAIQFIEDQKIRLKSLI